MAEDDMERLYDCGEKLATAENKAEKVAEYRAILGAAEGGSKAKLFAAQQLPRFFKHFPALSAEGIGRQLDLCEDDDINIRVTAIRGLPYFCKDTPEHLPQIADVLGQLLVGEDAEHTVVENSLMQVLRQSPKECLSAVFKHIDSPEEKIRDSVLAFIKAKVIPNKKTLLQPQEEMERHVTDLIKAVKDVSGDEFAVFMDFLKSLALFGPQAKAEAVQELVGIIEAQANLSPAFSETDDDHLERVLACLKMAVPFFSRGGSNSRFIDFIARQLLPAFSKLPKARHTDLLKAFAEAAPNTAPSDARTALPAVVALIKELVPEKKSASDPALDLVHVETLLYAFQSLAHKAPNATNPLCGYKIVTGQPSDQLGKDFSEQNKKWLARIAVVEEDSKKQFKAVLAESQEVTKSLRSAKGEEADKLKSKKAELAEKQRSCNNIDKLIKGLKAKTPDFLGPKSLPRPSWFPEAAPAQGATASPAAAGTKRAPTGAAEGGASAKKLNPGQQPKQTQQQGQQPKQQAGKQQQQKQQQQQQQQKTQLKRSQQQKQQQQQQQQKQQQKQRQQQQQQQQQLQLQQQQQLLRLQQQQQQQAAALLAQQPALAMRALQDIMSAQGVVPLPLPMVQAPIGGRGLGRGQRGRGRGWRGGRGGRR